MRFFFIIGILLIFGTTTNAQENWRKHAKLAEDLERKAQYAESAEHYRFAWVLKPQKRDLIHKAAENYSIIKDYENAAEAYRAVAGRKKYPLAGFKYALALKQQGKYEEASRAFSSFKENYKGKDNEYWARRSDLEIIGCELAMRLPQFSEKPDAIVSHPGITVNSSTTDFAPIPVSENILYFSSTRSGRAQIYRAESSGKSWSSASLPTNFPSISQDHYCNGTLSPDNDRFYFTICKSVESWGGLTTRCEIYVTQRLDNSWASPQRLDDYINDPNATTTHPHVVHNGDTEILYFSSNRTGGEGGMDIWYATRNIYGSNTDFTIPVNLGGNINTGRDEITPFYTLENATLYFSSNGHPSMGGYDIYSSTGSHTQWERPVNHGYPYNSSADDFYYVLKSSRTGGYLVSNRKAEEKPTTTDEDIFTFYFPNADGAELQVNGEVFDKETGQPVNDLTVSLYEQEGPGSKTLVDAYFFPDGNFELKLSRNARFLLEFKAPQYQGFSQVVHPSKYQLQEELVMPIHLEAEVVTPEPEIELPIITPPEETKEPDQLQPEETTTPPDFTQDEEEPVPYTTRGQSPADDYEVVTAAPRHTGTYYKVQLIAVVRYSEEHKRYQPVKDLGRLDTEFIVDRKLYRVLLADYGTEEEAKEVLKKVKTRGFEGAYIVKYQDGQRMGRI